MWFAECVPARPFTSTPGSPSPTTCTVCGRCRANYTPPARQSRNRARLLTGSTQTRPARLIETCNRRGAASVGWNSAAHSASTCGSARAANGVAVSLGLLLPLRLHCRSAYSGKRSLQGTPGARHAQSAKPSRDNPRGEVRRNRRSSSSFAGFKRAGSAGGRSHASVSAGALVWRCLHKRPNWRLFALRRLGSVPERHQHVGGR